MSISELFARAASELGQLAEGNAPDLVATAQLVGALRKLESGCKQGRGRSISQEVFRATRLRLNAIVLNEMRTRDSAEDVRGAMRVCQHLSQVFLLAGDGRAVRVSS